MSLLNFKWVTKFCQLCSEFWKEKGSHHEASCCRILLAAPELLILHLQVFVFLICKVFLNSSGEEAVSVNGGMYFYKALSD